ncbi:unnamed protein product [Schistosoma curassoni]|uniref:Uncharacterized protein n=1 Tax=Schistosoma curassoni TaxID=6186 RepID=A0A183KCA5_9TREM|nr:unnamed protein product [Schistosoma curassoni]
MISEDQRTSNGFITFIRLKNKVFTNLSTCATVFGPNQLPIDLPSDTPVRANSKANNKKQIDIDITYLL